MSGGSCHLFSTGCRLLAIENLEARVSSRFCLLGTALKRWIASRGADACSYFSWLYARRLPGRAIGGSDAHNAGSNRKSAPWHATQNWARSRQPSLTNHSRWPQFSQTRATALSLRQSRCMALMSAVLGCALRFLKRSPPQCVQVTILSAVISFRQNLTSESKETHRAFFHLGARRVVFTHEEHVVAWRDHGIVGAQEI